MEKKDLQDGVKLLQETARVIGTVAFHVTDRTMTGVEFVYDQIKRGVGFAIATPTAQNAIATTKKKARQLGDENLGKEKVDRVIQGGQALSKGVRHAGQVAEDAARTAWTSESVKPFRESPVGGYLERSRRKVGITLGLLSALYMTHSPKPKLPAPGGYSSGGSNWGHSHAQQEEFRQEELALMERIETDADEVLEEAEDYKNKPYFERVIIAATEKDPKKAVEILEEIESNQSTDAQLQNQRLKNAIASGLRNTASRIVRDINDRHNQPNETRFQELNGKSADQLYSILTFGEQEIFTSSFLGVYTRLQTQMRSESLSGVELLENLHYRNFRIFVKLLVSFGRFDEFLTTMSESEKSELLGRFVKNIEKEPNALAEATAIAETFSVVQGSDILEKLQRLVRQEYERTESENNENGKKLYGILAGMFGNRAVYDQAWFAQMSERFHLTNVTQIPVEKLFNQEGLHIQRHYFYNDDDGSGSYAHCLERYRNNPNWQIEDKETYTVITSTGEHHVKIYLNKPDQEHEGNREINDIFAQHHLSPHIIVHRGHSYHINQTLQQISLNAAMVFLGSCGGYNNVNEVLRRSPAAHIISTQQEGTKRVNDPMLFKINTTIARGEPLDWPVLWQQLSHDLEREPRFLSYVPPHKNLGALFLRAYQSANATTVGRQ